MVVSWVSTSKSGGASWQARLGKKGRGGGATDLNAGGMTFGRATGRQFAKIITGLIPLGVGFMLAGLTERRQALHDMIASCLVLRDN